MFLCWGLDMPFRHFWKVRGYHKYSYDPARGQKNTFILCGWIIHHEFPSSVYTNINIRIWQNVVNFLSPSWAKSSLTDWILFLSLGCLLRERLKWLAWVHYSWFPFSFCIWTCAEGISAGFWKGREWQRRVKWHFKHPYPWRGSKGT